VSKKEKLAKLKEKMEKAELPLKEDATQLVFGVGNPEAELLFIGEGPGYWEDQKGIPFVGNAGKLLDRLLMSIKLPREHVFITNVVCYRPPQNRDPLPEEIEAFQPYIDKIISIIDPKVIITLGRFSMAKFIPGVRITDAHGKPHAISFHGRKLLVVPMYHPAAALRNGEILRRSQEDFARLPEYIKKRDEIISEAFPGQENKKSQEEPESEQMQLI